MRNIYLLAFGFIVFLTSNSFAQDEIVIKKTGEPLDFDLKITDVTNDTIKFKAFRKDKTLPFTDVISYKIKGSPRVSLANAMATPMQQRPPIKQVSVEQMDSISRLKNLCLTVGILQGGGSLLGVDIDVKILKQLSIQGGLGLTSFGGALNYHLKPGIKSSCISLSYWHQGFEPYYIQSILGPTYVYRGRKGFTSQFGIGKVLELSSLGRDNYKKLSPNSPPPSVILIYSLGWCFAL